MLNISTLNKTLLILYCYQFFSKDLSLQTAKTKNQKVSSFRL